MTRPVGLRAVSLIACLVCACATANPAIDAKHREVSGYVGTVIAEWLNDGRRMRIIEPFAFIDEAGSRWDVPAGSIVDGASIPRFAWSIIGGPFEGLYREASVIHDVACDERRRPWPEVHSVFYEAMLASGVGVKKAKIMYAAVYHFGPRWEHAYALHDVTEGELKGLVVLQAGSQVQVTTERLPAPPCNAPPCAYVEPRYDALIRYKAEPTDLSEKQFEELRSLIETEDLSLSEIQAYVR